MCQPLSFSSCLWYAEKNRKTAKTVRDTGGSMKKRNTVVYAGAVLVTVLALGGAFTIKNTFFGQKDKSEKEQELNGEYAMKAVYLENQQGKYMFVDLTNETPFLGTIPKEGVYDEREEKISGDDLESGDVVLVWGNGAVAQSYPAQYNGITKIQVKEKKNQKYEETYKHYLDEFFPKEDLTQVPTLDISYAQPNALVAASIPKGETYTWTYETENKEKKTISADGPQILQWKDMTRISLENGTQTELLFSVVPEKTEVFRWSQEEWEKAKDEESAADLPEGETVQVTENQAGNPVISCDTGYVYQVKAYWENGEAEYGFYTEEI